MTRGEKGAWELSWHGYLLAGIVLAALILRLWGLGAQSLWFDELFSLKHARLDFWPMLVSLAEDGTNLPAYHIFLKAWVALFGVSEISVRLPSVLFGVLTVPLVYRLGADIFNKQTGLFGAFMISISSFHIYYAQEARMYTLLAVLMAASSLSLLKWQKEKNAGSAGIYILISGLLLYTHYFGMFLIAAQNIYILTLVLFGRKEDRPPLGAWVVMQGVSVALFLPWVILWFIQIGDLDNALWLKPLSVSYVIVTFMQFVNGPVSLILCGAVLGLAGAKLFWNRKSSANAAGVSPLSLAANSGVYYLIIWALALIIIPVIVSVLYRPVYHPRYVIGASLPFYLLVGGALTFAVGKPALRLLFVALLIAFAVPDDLKLYQPGIKPQWREAVHLVEARAEPGDLVLIVGEHHILNYDYYAWRSDLVVTGRIRVVRNFNALNSDGRRRQRVARDFMALTRGHDRVWLIAHEKEDGGGVVQSVLSDAFRREDDIALAHLRLSLFTR